VYGPSVCHDDMEAAASLDSFVSSSCNTERDFCALESSAAFCCADTFFMLPILLKSSSCSLICLLMRSLLLGLDTAGVAAAAWEGVEVEPVAVGVVGGANEDGGRLTDLVTASRG